MANKHLTEIVANIHQLANRLEANGLDGEDYQPALNIHGVRDRTSLAKLVRMLDAPVPNQVGNTKWVCGFISGVEVTIYYDGFFIGESRRERIVEFDVDESPDLSALVRELDSDASVADSAAQVMDEQTVRVG